jgi:hypothetical protein
VVVYAFNFKDAEKYLEQGKIDGVISDIFFPYHKREKGACCGVAVMTLCMERTIPCIMITDAHHHSDLLQWICSLQRGFCLPEFVDVCTITNSHTGEYLPGLRYGMKNWEEALRVLQKLISLGPCRTHNRYDWNVIKIDGVLTRRC